jgi:hypothetical protein
MVEFYDVKSRAKVSLGENDIAKVTYESTTKTGATQVRYALRGDYQGRKLTKFVGKADWDALNVKHG